MVSVRLSDELQKKLEVIARTEKKSKSEIIELALKQYFINYENDKSHYQLGEEFFGNYRYSIFI